MFNLLPPLATDPILGLISRFQQDPRQQKVDLGVGVYRDAQGNTPVFASVKVAERRLLESEQTKAYIGPAGNPDFNLKMSELIMGVQHSRLADLVLMQTPGGCGALRVAAELIVRLAGFRGASAGTRPTLWVSDPTWGNHIPLLGNAGVEIKTYPYYHADTHQLNFEGMLQTLGKVAEGDVVLLHGCCHNPCGADLSIEQWQAVSDLANSQGFIPFVDMAYQGFGDDLDADAAGLRLLAEQVPEVVLAISCSKNFGLYRERVGAVGVISQQPNAVASHIANIVRGIYSMPPSHGAAIVAEVLSDEALAKSWREELETARTRIVSNRRQLVEQLNTIGADGRFDHIARQKGMFSFVGINQQQVAKLITEFGIYMVDSGRISLAGLNPTNLDYFCESLIAVMDT
ncbi:aromatic amino acid transaminase [Teredinibacter waterburyi]|uniref:amino acid aminotransferase n=1 Tax=Teredinibacter waterburyi TaxID=1500538 RepID=UPI00165F466B|nr:amino acid aminotransferase [Teredinibacter waterburyi]